MENDKLTLRFCSRSYFPAVYYERRAYKESIARRQCIKSSLGLWPHDDVIRRQLSIYRVQKGRREFVRFLHWYTNYLGWCFSIVNLQISRRNSLVSWLRPRIMNVSLADDEIVFWSLHSLCVVRNGIGGVIIRHHTLPSDPV